MKLSILIVTAACLFTSSCATNTGDPAKDARGRATNAVLEQAFNAAVSFGLGAGRDYMTGQNGQDAAGGAFDAAKTAVSGFNFGKIISAYAGPEVGANAGKIFTEAEEKSPATAKSVIADTIGAGLQLAANQLFKRSPRK